MGNVRMGVLRWMGRAGAFTLALVLAATAWAVDFAEYARLLSDADTAHQVLDAGGGDDPVHLQRAAEADSAVIDWLDAFLGTEDFEGLADDQKATLIRGRYRSEYNLAGVLIPLDRCVEARDRVRALLDSAINDADLRPLLVERYDEAQECANRAITATLVVFAQPTGASVLVDGVFVGNADVPHEVELGEHLVTVDADGYFPQESTLLAEVEGETYQVGPIQLELMPVSDAGKPTWYEWTLWGAGAASLGTGVVFWFMWKDINDDLNNPNIDVANREEAEKTRDNRFTAAIVFTSVGAVAAIAGTISYLLRQGGDDEPTEEAGLGWSIGPGSVFLDYRF